MTGRIRLGWLLVGLTVAVYVVGALAIADTIAAGELGPNVVGFGDSDATTGGIPIVALASSATVLGMIVVLRRPDSPSGLLLLVFGIALPAMAVAYFVADWIFVRNDASNGLWIALLTLGGLALPIAWAAASLFLLTFPTGETLTKRWRLLGWLAVAGAVLFGAVVLSPDFLSSDPVEYGYYYTPGVENPLAVTGMSDAMFGWTLSVGIFMLFIALFGGLVSLVVRYFRSTGQVRRQLRIVGFTVVVVTFVALVAANLDPLGGVYSWFFEYAAPYLFLLIPLSFGVAVLRHDLYDIDLVISKTVTYGVLAVFITAVYASAVVGVGALIGTGDEPNIALAVGATALVALLFEPVRSRVQRLANRLVYGERATPYAVLSELTARYAASESNDEAMERLAGLVASGTGATQSVVWLRVGDRLRPEAVLGAGETRSIELDRGALPDLGMDAVEPITRGEELLGALSIVKERTDPVTPADRRLLADVAAGAGLLLRNIRLNAELAERAEDLRVSRRRLVAAQDAERRQLERNLHDGAQQEVVALKVKLGLARTLAEREEVADIAAAVTDLADDTQRAVDGMRATARGIYPPLLEAEGIRAALLAAARDAGVELDVDGGDLGRYPAEVEATVYFSVLESMAPGARVSVFQSDGMLGFTIEGAATRGATAAVADRIDALGGGIDQVGDHHITGFIPAVELEPA